VAHEREDGRDARDAVARGRAAHQDAGEGDEPGVAREREGKTMEEGTADPGAAGQDPERVQVQAGSSSRPSSRLFSTAGSMSRTARA
jgi:hypothetical protein